MKFVDVDKVRNEYTDVLSKTYSDDYANGFRNGVLAVIENDNFVVHSVKRGKWIMKDNKGTGVCNQCYRQDHIDSLAKYCRYCGAEMK